MKNIFKNILVFLVCNFIFVFICIVIGVLSSQYYEYKVEPIIQEAREKKLENLNFVEDDTIRLTEEEIQWSKLMNAVSELESEYCYKVEGTNLFFEEKYAVDINMVSEAIKIIRNEHEPDTFTISEIDLEYNKLEVFSQKYSNEYGLFTVDIDKNTVTDNYYLFSLKQFALDQCVLDAEFQFDLELVPYYIQTDKLPQLALLYNTDDENIAKEATEYISNSIFMENIGNIESIVIYCEQFEEAPTQEELKLLRAVEVE